MGDSGTHNEPAIRLRQGRQACPLVKLRRVCRFTSSSRACNGFGGGAGSLAPHLLFLAGGSAAALAPQREARPEESVAAVGADASSGALHLLRLTGGSACAGAASSVSATEALSISPAATTAPPLIASLGSEGGQTVSTTLSESAPGPPLSSSMPRVLSGGGRKTGQFRLGYLIIGLPAHPSVGIQY